MRGTITAPIVAAGSGTAGAGGIAEFTASDSFVDLGGSFTNFTFRKRYSDTSIQVDMTAVFYANNATTGATFGVHIAGNDYVVTQLPSPLTAFNKNSITGQQTITGVPAGEYTIQARWRRSPGSTANIVRNVADWLSMSAVEVALP